LVFYPKNEHELEALVTLLTSKVIKADKPNSTVTIFLPHEQNMIAKIALPPQSFDIQDITELQSIFTLTL
jgi:hypothetical protein